MKFLAMLLIFFCSMAPAAAETLATAEGVILKDAIPTTEAQPVAPPTPVVIVPAVQERTFAEKHPVLAMPFVNAARTVKRIGAKAKLKPIGVICQKTCSAASDAFIAFGKKTEPYHPGMQTCGYLGQLAVPFIFPFFRK